MKRALRAVLVVGLLCAGWLTSSARAAELPEDVVLFAEVANVTQAGASISGLLWQIAPEAPMPPIEDAIVPLTRTADAWTVDMSAPIQWISVAQYMQSPPVLVFSARDPERYLDSLTGGLEHERDEDGLHFYLETQGNAQEWAADEWDMPQAKSVVIAVAGNRIAIGENEGAVRRVAELAAEGQIASGVHFEGADAGASLRVSGILEALQTQGLDPFTIAKIQLVNLATMSAAAQEQPIDMEALIGAAVDGLQSILTQTEIVTATVTLGQEEYDAMFRVDPVAGSGLAGFIAQTPRGMSDLVRFAPADSMGVWTMNVGDLSPTIEWYESLLAAISPEGEEMAVAIRKIGDAMREGMSIMGDSMMMSVRQSTAGPLSMTTATRVKDREAAERFYSETQKELWQEIARLQEPLGVKTTFAPSEEPTLYKGHEITEWTMAFEFQPPQVAGPQGAPQPAQIATMQRAMVAQLWGPEMRGYQTFIDDVYVYTQGPDGLARIKEAIDTAGQPREIPEMLAAASEDMPEDAVSVGFLSVEELANFYVYALAQAMREAEVMMVVPMLEAMSFEVGRPVSVGAWITEDGALVERVRLPLTSVTNIVNGVRQAMMGQNMRAVP
jgi:hypothetical protein